MFRYWNTGPKWVMLTFGALHICFIFLLGIFHYALRFSTNYSTLKFWLSMLAVTISKTWSAPHCASVTSSVNYVTFISCLFLLTHDLLFFILHHLLNFKLLKKYLPEKHRVSLFMSIMFLDATKLISLIPLSWDMYLVKALIPNYTMLG